MFSFSSKKILSKLLSLLNNSLSTLKISGRNIYNHSAFTLTELIVVITILSILSVIGFVVMSHQSSVARDGKRISDIQTLSQSAKITSAQLRLLPTPIADSVSLTVSGTFIGYQGFMSLALVNPLGYGSDKIFDPKDNIPYTYRVNQYYDSAQFMAYLENPRFERSIEIAKNQFLRNEEVGMNGGGFDGGLSRRGDDDRNRENQEVGMNGFGGLFDNREQLNGGGFDGKKIQEIASQSLPSVLSSTLSSALPSILPSLFSQAYALDSSTTDLSSRYPYSAGDRLGIFLSKGSNQPLQNGVTGTGSRDISLSDTSTLTIIVGSSGADGYVSTDISTGSLLSLKDGSFDEKALFGMNGGGAGGGGSGSGGGDSGGGGNNGGSLSGYILTMGEYTFLGQQVYGYIGPGFLNGPYASYITTITAGDLTPKTIDGKVIDSIFFFQGQQILLLEDGSGIPNVVVSEGSQNSNCLASSALGSVQIFECESVSIVGPYTVGEMRSLGMDAGEVAPPPLQDDCGLAGYEVDSLNNLTGQSKTAIQWCSTTSFNMSNHNSASIPTPINKLKNLEILDVSHNTISNYPGSIPSELSNLTSLKILNLSDNQLSHIPPVITSMSGLTTLSINNNIGNLIVPNEIGNLTHLESLSLNGTQITSLPDNIGDLQALKYLHLANGPLLTSLPNSFGTLSHLEGLYLGGNPFSSFPLAITSLTSLKILDIPYINPDLNNVLVLPESIGDLTQLTDLNIGHNNISSLPDSIGNMTQLESLTIESNHINVFPATFSGLINLKYLYANNGGLGQVPEFIGNYTQLRYLGLVANQITSLPASLVNLHQLTNISLSANPGLGSLAQEFESISPSDVSQAGIPTANETMTITSNGGVISITAGYPSIHVAAGYTNTCVIRSDATLKCWGMAPYGRGSDNYTLPAPSLGSITKISLGSERGCAIEIDGTLKCWGPSGILPNMTDVTQVSDATCEVKTDYTSSCLAPDDFVTSVSVGSAHRCKIALDGTLSCWGSNGWGQLDVPAGIGSVLQVTAGMAHTCAIRSDNNNVECWGSNQYGEINVPSDLGAVTQISTRWYHTCAIKTDGTLRCWGNNQFGEANVPSDLGTVIDISSGQSHTCAIKTNGSLKCWGYNYFGQLNIPSDIKH